MSTYEGGHPGQQQSGDHQTASRHEGFDGREGGFENERQHGESSETEGNNFSVMSSCSALPPPELN